MELQGLSDVASTAAAAPSVLASASAAARGIAAWWADGCVHAELGCAGLWLALHGLHADAAAACWAYDCKGTTTCLECASVAWWGGGDASSAGGVAGGLARAGYVLR